MSKPRIDSVIVVEGKTDKQFLLSFIDAHIVETNGSAISDQCISELIELSKDKEILIITDPDSPGEKIRNTIIQKITKTSHIYLEKKDCMSNGKVGLAQSNKEYLLEKLKNRVVLDKQVKLASITLFDLYKLDLIGTPSSFEKRRSICRHLNLAICNGKQLLQKLNWMNINLELLRNFTK